MDRYKTVDNANADKRSIYDNGKYRNPEWCANELNTLTRELAKEKARVEELEKVIKEAKTKLHWDNLGFDSAETRAVIALLNRGLIDG